MKFEPVVESLHWEGFGYEKGCSKDGIELLYFWLLGIVSEVGTNRNHKSFHVLSHTWSLEAWLWLLHKFFFFVLVVACCVGWWFIINIEESTVSLKICDLCCNLPLIMKSVDYCEKLQFFVFKTHCVFSYPISETHQLEIADLVFCSWQGCICEFFIFDMPYSHIF